MTLVLICGILSFNPDTHRVIRVCLPAQMLTHRRLAGVTRGVVWT